MLICIMPAYSAISRSHLYQLQKIVLLSLNDFQLPKYFILPLLQFEPVQPGKQVHILGAEQVPPLAQLEEHVAEKH